MKPDPKKPYKALASIVAVMVGSLLTNSAVTLNPWVAAFLIALLAGIAVYVVPNPKVSE